MNVKLISEPDNALSAKVQVLKNRGIPLKEMRHYLNTTDADINDPTAFGEDLLKRAAAMLVEAISKEKKTLVVVDADCDGFTSSALLINYLYDVFPAFVNNKLDWYLHPGKQHGLSDCWERAKNYEFVILPDSSSNDYEYHKKLADEGIQILVLDHHEAEKISPYACVINNQLSDYPNKNLSGVGVTWQFCRYLDRLLNYNYANNYKDLVALGDMADMMSMREFETKHLIFEGFKPENINNPFIYEIAQKNSYSLSKSDYKPSRESGMQFSPMGAAFFISPFVNAIVRSGTLEEKELIFNSMIKFKAFEEIPSNKRGHKPGEMERVVDQAMRTCTNVKNRQTRAQDAGVELLESLIEKNNMLEHKVLLFLLEPGQVDKNIAGLIANKLMAKYQRPCCILTKVVSFDAEDKKLPMVSYQGSARGYDASGFTTFKSLCASAPGCMFAEGHQGAFGLGLDLGARYGDERDATFGEEIYQFIDYTDEKLKDMASEPSYFVDYDWDCSEVDGDKILDMAEMNDFLGKDIERPLVHIKNIVVSEDNFVVMKSNTLKYRLPNGIDIIQFGGTDDEINLFQTKGAVKINCICKCCANEWNWSINPQLQLVDYEIIDQKAPTVSDVWGF